jgi:hypothetical protein
MLAATVSALTIHCQARSVGPGSLHRGGTAGAACLLNAFRNACKPADYTLSAFGVDTVHSEMFRTQAASGGCHVLVTESFRVVPQSPHVTLERTCPKLLTVGTDVVAGRCTGKAPHTISLTSLSG